MANQTIPAIQIKDSNVGIGTTSPSYKLDVDGGAALATARFYNSSNVATVVYVGDSGNTDYSDIILQTNSGTGEIFKAGTGYTSYGGALALNIYNSNGAIAFHPNNTANAMFIATSGNVGIGTTNPGAKLEVNGNIYQSSGILYSDHLTPFSGNQLQLLGGGSNYLYINGNVGIGTTAPNRTLTVNGVLGVASGTTNVPELALSADGSGTYISSTYKGTSSYQPLVFETNGSEKVRITTGGNVGIGTTNPGGLLGLGVQTSVQGTSGITLGVNDNNIEFVHATFGNGFGSKFYSVDSGGGVTSLRIAGRGNSTSWSDLVTILVTDSGSTRGNVGIGTTGPTEKLHVDGSTLITYNNSFQSTNSVGNKAILARVSPTSGIINYAEYATATNLNGFVIGSDDARVKGNITGDSLEFITNTSTRMTILSGGNVGINTTTPGSTLHVVGDVLIQTGALGVGVNPNATDGRIDASNDIVAFSTSDKRLKENITPIANALEKVKSLTGVEFDWKEETKSVHGYEGHDVGVIAQDVQAVLPEAVRTNDTGYLSVRYEKMIALLIEANKELANRVEQLEKLIK